MAMNSRKSRLLGVLGATGTPGSVLSSDGSWQSGGGQGGVSQGQVDASIATHAGLADPHTGYQKESEKDVASGYCGLDAGGLVPDARLPAGLARDSEVSSAISAAVTSHVEASDPHPGYATDADLSAHVAAADPHTGYQRESEKAVASGYASLDGSTLVPVAQLGTGSPTGSKFLRDDRTWQTPTAQASPVEPFNKGGITITTGSFMLVPERVEITGTDALTIEGTGLLRII